MKIQANTNPSGSFDNPHSHPHRMKQDEVVEMCVEDNIAFVPTPLPMIGYRSDIPELIVEDRLPPRPELVSVKCEATLRLRR